ncbi:MAG: 1-(5-phosphoribosyl)-5-[(5-phosphoribosylamino)methylideneamino] imidazole-4-carboxamide isomerase [Chloroflexi bacterium]|nr:1-(5-phosphoribosyl)-5-[(5-phosphoribosylamino)methylideneamino] imidazole-4-carboxamide isomerase [Chloroflexota bacterium]
MIVYPAIDLRGGRVVRLRQGQAEAETIYSHDPAAIARLWVAQGAQWLHVVNLDGAFGTSRITDHASRITHHAPRTPINLQRLAEIHIAVPDTPIQFGGGLRTLADVATALELGAARIILGTVAVREPELVTAAVRRFGAARVAVAIDARQGRVATHGWQETSEVTALALGQAMRERGVRYAVYTDILRDGMLSGVNVQSTAALARATGLRVIASGGVATPDDVRRLRAEEAAGIAGVIIGQALYSGALSLAEALRAAQE